MFYSPSFLSKTKSLDIMSSESPRIDGSKKKPKVREPCLECRKTSPTPPQVTPSSRNIRDNFVVICRECRLNRCNNDCQHCYYIRYASPRMKRVLRRCDQPMLDYLAAVIQKQRDVWKKAFCIRSQAGKLGEFFGKITKVGGGGVFNYGALVNLLKCIGAQTEHVFDSQFLLHESMWNKSIRDPMDSETRISSVPSSFLDSFDVMDHWIGVASMDDDHLDIRLSTYQTFMRLCFAKIEASALDPTSGIGPKFASNVNTMILRTGYAEQLLPGRLAKELAKDTFVLVSPPSDVTGRAFLDQDPVYSTCVKVLEGHGLMTEPCGDENSKKCELERSVVNVCPVDDSQT